MLLLSVIIKSMNDGRAVRYGDGVGQGRDRTNVRKIGGGDHYFFTPTHVPYACVIDFVLAPRKNMTHSTLFDIRTFRDGDA